MKIGILGPPNSGKTDLALGLKEAFTDKYGFGLVDEYVENLESATGNSYGHFAGYIANLQVAFERLTLEEEARRVHTHSITCGTVIDSMIYAALYSEFARDNAPNKQAEYARVSTTMHTFGMMVLDTFDYDVSFYLPYTQEYRQEHDGEWNTFLDLEYPGAFIGSDLSPILLDDGDVNNLAKAVQAVFEAASDEPIYAATAGE